jgi:hypothetical protein
MRRQARRQPFPLARPTPQAPHPQDLRLTAGNGRTHPSPQRTPGIPSHPAQPPTSRTKPRRRAPPIHPDPVVHARITRTGSVATTRPRTARAHYYRLARPQVQPDHGKRGRAKPEQIASRPGEPMPRRRITPQHAQPEMVRTLRSAVRPTAANQRSDPTKRRPQPRCLHPEPTHRNRRQPPPRHRPATIAALPTQPETATPDTSRRRSEKPPHREQPTINQRTTAIRTQHSRRTGCPGTPTKSEVTPTGRT